MNAQAISIGKVLLSEARERYREMSRAWVGFVLALARLHSEGVWSSLGYNSFPELYHEHFPGLSKEQVCKFLRIAAEYSASELNTCKTASFDVLYELAIRRGAFKKEEFDALKLRALRGDFTRSELRRILRERSGKTPSGVHRIMLSSSDLRIVLRVLRAAGKQGLALKIKAQVTP